MRSKLVSRGLTLTEVLIVVGIIALLCAITLPTLSSARRAAHRATAISNLRQTAVALAMYRDSDSSTVLLPSRQTAKALVPSEISWDPDDSWRRDCREDWGDPMLGSFGYAGSLPISSLVVSRDANGPLLIDIFQHQTGIEPFHGNGSPPPGPDNPWPAQMPTTVLVARMDTSVKSEHPGLPSSMRMNWQTLFLQLTWRK